jgi:gamma-glutamyltranspeptidase/glutathione hydrolase
MVQRRAKAWAGAICAATIGLAGCGPDIEEPKVASPRTVPGFAGIVAAEEPRAATIGRDILGNNGTAVDAAVGMAFAMSVTLPSRVGLGGGGACIVHREAENTQDALIFMPGSGRDGAAVPALARGMAALHARHGLTPWAELVRPAERLAAFGHDVSRAFREDLVAGRDRLGVEARRIYLGTDGRVPDVGQRLRQPALGAALAGLRQRGVGHMMTGTFARTLSEGAREAGQPLTIADIRETVPSFETPLRTNVGKQTVFLPPAPVAAGPRAAALWGALNGESLGETGSAARWRALNRAWRGADGVSAPAGDSAAGAGFAVADRFGNMVACSFTLNGLFGSGAVAKGTGILLATPRASEVAGLSVLPAVVANGHTGTGYLAAAVAGDSAAADVLTQTLAEVRSAGGVDIEPNLSPKKRALMESYEPGQDDAAAEGLVGIAPLLRAPRATPAAGGRVLRHEAGLSREARRLFREAGYGLEQTRALGRISVVHCPRGVKGDSALCTASADPRGRGMAVRAP